MEGEAHSAPDICVGPTNVAVTRNSNSRLRDSGSNPVLQGQTSGKFSTLHLSVIRNSMNEYLAIYSGRYLYTNNRRPLISAWLYASQRSRDDVWLNRFARE